MRYQQRTVYPQSSKQPKSKAKNHDRALRSEIAYKPSHRPTFRNLIVYEKQWKNVAEVVEEATKRYPRQLAFALNSRSEVKESPFLKPNEVWQALKWLATTYCNARKYQVGEVDFDRSIRDFLTWRYTAHQSRATMARNQKAYTARVDGKEYILEEHIGTNRSGDPQHTIRIAFGWDAKMEKVVIGYVGLHQPTQRS